MSEQHRPSERKPPAKALWAAKTADYRYAFRGTWDRALRGVCRVRILEARNDHLGADGDRVLDRIGKRLEAECEIHHTTILNDPDRTDTPSRGQLSRAEPDIMRTA